MLDGILRRMNPSRNNPTRGSSKYEGLTERDRHPLPIRIEISPVTWRELDFYISRLAYEIFERLQVI